MMGPLSSGQDLPGAQQKAITTDESLAGYPIGQRGHGHQLADPVIDH